MSRKSRNADDMFDRRMFMAAGAGGLIWAGLVARFFQLQYMEADHYQGLAEANHVKLVMAPPEDCFAVYTPYSEDSHGSLYLGLLGRDVPAGQTATSRARFVVGRNLTDEQAVEAYRDYVRTIVR